MILFIDRLPLYAWTRRTGEGPQRLLAVSLPLLVTEKGRTSPPTGRPQRWAIDTRFTAEAFAWRSHLLEAGLNPNEDLNGVLPLTPLGGPSRAFPELQGAEVAKPRQAGRYPGQHQEQPRPRRDGAQRLGVGGQRDRPGDNQDDHRADRRGQVRVDLRDAHLGQDRGQPGEQRRPAALFTSVVVLLCLGLAALQYRYRYEAVDFDPEFIRRSALTSLVVLSLGLVYLGLGFAEASLREPHKGKRRVKRPRAEPRE